MGQCFSRCFGHNGDADVEETLLVDDDLLDVTPQASRGREQEIHQRESTPAEEAAARKKAEEEAAAREKAKQEEAKKKAEEEAAARKKAEEEAAAREKAKQEEAKKKAEEEAAARKKAEEEEAAKKSGEAGLQSMGAVESAEPVESDQKGGDDLSGSLFH
uniref:Uncharacterized protein n=1 Tax=Guillardia theta TaxID=55529 RepID=A0A7S4P7B6_GUITH|mmetsp:Transcript_44544/g.140543  ORF Transcript_44544/g.140543 Transcript_44544/m.140543 type:complete len:160 (+) Transcript_44544:282-761(+)